MNDLIPQDLIKFVEANRPEVLPDILMVINLHAKTRLQSECEKIIFLWNKLDGSNYRISEDHAAALLEHWLFDWLDSHYELSATNNGEIDGVVDVDDVYCIRVGKKESYGDTWLEALWEAYKQVKGIKE